MRILLVNDDGYHSERLHFAKEALAEFGDVWVVAPKEEQSGCAMAITPGPIPYEKINEREYVIKGTPSDCVSFGIFGLKMEPDVVISGVNYGYNLGTDYMYSGTVNAAMQATHFGYKAIAFSAHYGGDESMKKYLAETMRYLIERHFISVDYTLNINFPKDNIEKYNGIRHTTPYDRPIRLIGELSGGRFVYKRDFDRFRKMPPDCDVVHLKQGKTVITRILVERRKPYYSI